MSYGIGENISRLSLYFVALCKILIDLLKARHPEGCIYIFEVFINKHLKYYYFPHSLDGVVHVVNSCYYGNPDFTCGTDSVD